VGDHLQIRADLVTLVSLSQGEEIGLSSSSRVSTFQDPKTGNTMAVKDFVPTSFNNMAFIREVESSVKLNHPYLSQIIAWAFQQ
jgi:hypothetical protein